MKWIKLFLLCHIICICAAQAQDVLPRPLAPQDTLANPDIHLRHGVQARLNAVAVGNSLPAPFRNAGENVIEDDSLLAPFFAKLCRGTEPVRIVQLGELGNFRLSLSSEGTAERDDFSESKLRKARVIFTPGEALRTTVETTSFAAFTPEATDEVEEGGGEEEEERPGGL